MNGYIDDKNFALIDFIRQHPDNWETLLKHEPYNLKSIKNCFWHQDWWMLVYNLFSSKLTDEIVRNCRGVVLSINGDEIKPVSVPYTKFFGYGDPSGKDMEDTINWSQAKFQMKVDGVLIKTACVEENGEKRLYFFTNGSFDLNAPFEDSLVYDEPETRNAEFYGDLLEVALKKIDDSVSINFDRELGRFYITGGWADGVEVGSTLMLELVSPRNKIICEYKKTKLYLHGYRGADLVETDPRKMDFGVKFEYPELLDASNFDDLKKILDGFDGNEKEGCVVVDYSTPGVPRAKIKCDSYLKLKFARDTSCNTHVLYKAVVFDEYDDLLAAVPTAAAKINEIKDTIKEFTAWFVAESVKTAGVVVKGDDPKVNKKRWAMWCKKNVRKELFPYYMLMDSFDATVRLERKLKQGSTSKQAYDKLCNLLKITKE